MRPRLAERGRPDSTPELVVVREAIEGLVAPPLATTLLFDALARWGAHPPERPEDVRTFVDGALEAVLRSALGDDEVEEIQRRIAYVLARAERSSCRDDEPTLKIARPQLEAATQEIPITPGRVPVVVVASGTSLSERLVASLGSHRIVAFPVTSHMTLSKALTASGALLVVLDATSPAPIDERILAWTLRSMRVGASVIVFGVETAAGRAVAKTLDESGAPLIEIDGRDGTTPLFDLVLARHAVPE